MTRFAFEDLLAPVLSADESTPGPARKILSAFAWIFSASVFFFSVYVIWGWITTSDVKRFCEQNKISYEEMASAFVSGRKLVIDTNQVITVTPREAAPVDRVSFVAQVLAVSYDTNSPSGGRQITMLDVSPLMPFLQMSENFLNLVYCFALGYFVSFIVMLVRIYRGVEQAVRVIASRPLLGGLCAACLYVLSIAATDLLLEQRGDFRFGSLPAMALIGALSVERFDRLLRSLDKR